jgi:hypothetical protein
MNMEINATTHFRFPTATVKNINTAAMRSSEVEATMEPSDISGSHGGEYKDDCLLESYSGIVKTDQPFKSAYCLQHQGDESYHPDDGGSRYL